jgi:Holliday junction resolvase RusA-like endonuclease
VRLHFVIHGKPQPAGSKRAFPIRRKQAGGWVATGKVAVTDDNPRARDWKEAVASGGYYALAATVPPDRYNGDPSLLTGPLGLAVTFKLARPKGHFGTGRNVSKVKPSAPARPITKPDATKLLRAVEDALTGVVWRDDAQVVEQSVVKVYGEPEGAEVVVWTL